MGVKGLNDKSVMNNVLNYIFFIVIDLNVNKQWPCGGNPNQYSKNLEGRHCQWKVLTKVLAVNWVLRIDFEFLYTNLSDSKRYSPFWLCEIVQSRLWLSPNLLLPVSDSLLQLPHISL